MSAESEKFNQPGDIVWEDLYLLNSNGARVDILGLCPEIHIFEDIFLSSMSGWATIVDTHGIIDTFPVMGQEELHVKFHTPTMGDSTMEKKFRVMSVTDREVVGNKQVYKIHFISYNAYVDLTFIESRALLGTSDVVIEQVLQGILDKATVLSHTPNKLKLIKGTELPHNRMKFVSPGWASFKCINYAASQAISGEYYVADYLFFESRSGYTFKALSEIFKQEPIDNFKYDASTGYESGKFSPEELMRKALSLKFVTNDDHMRRFMHKAYGSKTYTHDLLTKRVTIEPIYSPKNGDSLKLPSMNGFECFARNAKEFNFSNNLNIQVANSHSLAHNEIIGDNNGLVTNTRDQMMARLGFTELNLEVWGRSWMEVGQLINISIGSYAERNNDTEKQESKKSSGKYLVTAVHHILAPSQHKMAIQCVKDSLIEPIEVFNA